MTRSPRPTKDQGAGVPATPSGYSAEPEPSYTVSAVPVSIPNAAERLLAGRYLKQYKERYAKADFALFSALDVAVSLFRCAELEEDEAYEIGKRDGYERAVQDIDLLTGGDGEYRYCMGTYDERHCPDAETMKARIAERFTASVDTHPKGGDAQQAPSLMGSAVGAAETPQSPPLSQGDE